jgi:class 3 adenylate cyclase
MPDRSDHDAVRGELPAADSGADPVRSRRGWAASPDFPWGYSEEDRRNQLDYVEHWWWLGDVDAIIDPIEELLTGSPPAWGDERVLKTVLFTDIVGSTERAAELGDRRWKEVLDAHDDAVRRQLARFGGVAVNTTGDGFLAAFDGPARAIHCTQAIVGEASGLGLEIRSGLHTGECELRGGDLAGIAVHIGARVAALAAPSQVLVTGTVRDLVAGSGIGFADRGHHELKGVPGSWQLLAAT